MDENDHSPVLLRPTRVFLDTFALVHLERLREGKPLGAVSREDEAIAYRRLNSLISQGLCIPVFCESQAYEWIHKMSDQQRVLRLARIFDVNDVRLQVEPQPAIFVIEAMMCMRQLHPEWGIPQMEPIGPFGYQKTSREFLIDHLPRDYNIRRNMTSITPPPSSPSIEYFVHLIGDEIRADDVRWGQALDGATHGFDTTKSDLNAHGKRPFNLKEATRRWLFEQIELDKIIQNITEHVDPKEVVKVIDLDECPATMLWTSAYMQFVRAKEDFGDHTDVTDLGLVSVVPYVDYALLDKRICSYVHQAGRELRVNYKSKVYKSCRELMATIDSQDLSLNGGRHV